MLKISGTDKRLEDIKRINKICGENNAPVVILGGGVYGKILEEYLTDNNVRAQIRYAVDDEYITEQQKKDGCMPFSEYLNEYAQKAPLVFGFYDYEVIKEKRRRFEGRIPYSFDFHLTVVYNKRLPWNRAYVEDNIEKFDKTYALLSDDASKQTMQLYLNAAVAGEFDELYTRCHEEIPYFNDRLKGRKIEKLFDCGAFDGDSMHDFINLFGDYKEIYEFEPDSSNVEKIRRRIENEAIRDARIIEKGVWSQTTKLRFEAEGKSSSSISGTGDVSVDVIRLDDMFDSFDKNSLIKMDIEGSELEALKGASRVIKEISPYLAVCVYHKTEDLIVIPEFIDSLAGSGTYDYYLGYQGLDLAELVFYAIPR